MTQKSETAILDMGLAAMVTIIVTFFVLMSSTSQAREKQYNQNTLNYLHRMFDGYALDKCIPAEHLGFYIVKRLPGNQFVLTKNSVLTLANKTNKHSIDHTGLLIGFAINYVESKEVMGDDGFPVLIDFWADCVVVK